MRLSWIITLVLLSLILLAPSGSRGGISAGATAPDFTLNDLSGASVTLSGLRGKVVMLEFWASWCPHCDASLPHTQKVNDQYKVNNLVVLGISSQDPSVVKHFMTASNYTFRVLIDSDQKVFHAYGVDAIPTIILVDQQGRVNGSFIGESPTGLDAAITNLTDHTAVTTTPPTPANPGSVSTPAQTGGASAPTACERLNAAPIWIGENLMVRARETFGPMGADVKWDPVNRTVTLILENQQIAMTVDRKSVVLNGQPASITSHAPMIINGRVMVPLRFTADSLGMKIDYTCTQCGLYLKSSDKCGFITF
jgi:peroxiredoxin